ncbi:hypothetical protein GWK47_020846 [Chionoecetes opilio]|uniref:Uncharacterized protein n=1 Tax=Chionoecetes opilio TaxID=41210 RepID=A0A8J5BVY0_CHIOP|nr:hypothetical protein GWK47_020846 [Chionoecetes opilio]
MTDRGRLCSFRRKEKKYLGSRRDGRCWRYYLRCWLPPLHYSRDRVRALLLYNAPAHPVESVLTHGTAERSHQLPLGSYISQIRTETLLPGDDGSGKHVVALCMLWPTLYTEMKSVFPSSGQHLQIYFVPGTSHKSPSEPLRIYPH